MRLKCVGVGVLFLLGLVNSGVGVASEYDVMANGPHSGGGSTGAVAEYSDELSFLAEAGTVSMESFESLTPTNAPTGDTALIAVTDFTMSVAAADIAVMDLVDLNGQHATDGTNWIVWQSGTNEILTFDFLFPINSFGINITDFGDFGNGQMTFSNDVGDSFVAAVTPLPNGNALFFGVINSEITFTRVEFLNTVQGEAMGLDEVYYGDNLTDDNTVTLCHIPPGNPSNAHTITVGAAAADAHLAHGDYLGPCENGAVEELVICRVPPGHPENAVPITLVPGGANSDLTLGDQLGPCGDSIALTLRIVADRSAPESTRTAAQDVLFKALGGGYDLEQRIDIIRGLVDRVDVSLEPLLKAHLVRLSMEAERSGVENLRTEVEWLLMSQDVKRAAPPKRPGAGLRSRRAR
jgi:hypothetical protein